jgi:16S rRNA (uracil1498-N3)-methyltransferase
MMERFYVAEQVKYIRKVLRLEEGAEVAVTDGRGQAYLCRLHSMSREAVEAAVLAPLQEDKEPRLKVVLCQGIPKGDKMDQVVQKTVELGVTEIVPLITRRCVVRLDEGKKTERQQRWQKIAISSLEQSGRNHLPRIREPLLLSQLLKGWGEESLLTIMPWEGEASQGLRAVLAGNPDPGGVRILIGPEGGFSPGEVQEAAAAGAVPVTLGPRIFRTETAGPAVIAMILYHFGELG